MKPHQVVDAYLQGVSSKFYDNAAKTMQKKNKKFKHSNTLSTIFELFHCSHGVRNWERV